MFFVPCRLTICANLSRKSLVQYVHSYSSYMYSSYMASFIINSIPPRAVVGFRRTKVYISFFFPFTYYELDEKNTTLLCRTAFILVYLQKTAQIIVNMLFWKTKVFYLYGTNDLKCSISTEGWNMNVPILTYNLFLSKH